MKKITTILVLLSVLSVSAFADGDVPLGGKSCPQGQHCLTDGQIPASGKTENPIIENILDYLKSIFG